MHMQTHTHTHIYIYIYIYAHTHTHTHTHPLEDEGVNELLRLLVVEAELTQQLLKVARDSLDESGTLFEIEQAHGLRGGLRIAVRGELGRVGGGREVSLQDELNKDRLDLKRHSVLARSSARQPRREPGDE
jgi:hypothetical protein